ncbi:src kinase-associated phosphoprotein 2 [Phyllopteryx taeniolatus]|uniref:src kinase-associated phosphoprotein 2 n=1 Tax=Phyllopteryx taeniolatus TaxID=161469 RepID=UPI002AD265B0|nr:src kinase-associated phosphoprotein 2 [Phyllopteryx taeniolatus]XP_061632599.1 src kinase-associated phosphoprotein 2 [Phyllopteryx taeniolatus]XP_061632600.1 src kinase-associated phosphoprotein 2 [Phyllopteryx taeniolatus]
MRDAPEEFVALISDLETFLCEGLKGENLSKKAKDKREAFIKRIKEVKLGFPHDFKEKSGEDSDDEEEVDSSNNDGASLQSERTDKEEDTYEGSQLSPPIAAQDLQSILMSGYLEKRRKDHSFFGQEWQKRWCALSYRTFYYYGHEKDKQQKGEFNIDGYNVKMNNSLRKDSKKDFCFEVSAPDKRDYQFCASLAKEAKEWVKWIDFVLKDKSGIIQEEEEEEEEVEKAEEQLMYDDVGLGPDTDIYEVLPDTSTDYQNYYQGLWDCVVDHPDELSFQRGDTIYILSKEYQSYGWWVGEKDGNIGIVPRDYLLELYAL